MQDLIAVGFQGMHRAAEVLGELQGLNNEWAIELDDAVAVYWTDLGKLRVDQSAKPTGGEGVSDEFVQQVGGVVTSGNSAVIAVIRAMDPHAVAEQLRGYGGTMLRMSLAPEQVASAQEIDLVPALHQLTRHLIDLEAVCSTVIFVRAA